MDLGLRYAPEFHIPPVLDLIAIILFAITGALSAARRGYDWIGACRSLSSPDAAAGSYAISS